MSAPLIGTTTQCFEDLIGRHRQLEIFKEIAAFCLPGKKDALAAVLNWEAGSYFPGGDALLRLRYMLYLMGYEVLEFERLDIRARRIVALIALGFKTPLEIRDHLGFRSSRATEVSSLWHLLLEGGTVSVTVGEKITSLLPKRRVQELKEAEAAKRQQLAELLQSLQQTPSPTVDSLTEPSAQSSMVGPMLAASFDRAVVLVLGLGQLMLLSPESQAEAIRATGNGQRLAELAELAKAIRATPFPGQSV